MFERILCANLTPWPALTQVGDELLVSSPLMLWCLTHACMIFCGSGMALIILMPFPSTSIQQIVAMCTFVMLVSPFIWLQFKVSPRKTFLRKDGSMRSVFWFKPEEITNIGRPIKVEVATDADAHFLILVGSSGSAGICNQIFHSNLRRSGHAVAAFLEVPFE